MNISIWGWIAFNLFVLAMLAVDLGIFNRKAHTIKFREALLMSALWVGISLLFNAWLYFHYGTEIGHEFLAGYLIEKSLSVDNIFVFIIIFQYFRVKPQYQHRVLFWGILSALIFRGALIAAGTALIHNFHWIIWVFGVFLIYTGIRMAFHNAEDVDPEKSIVFRWARRTLPVTDGERGQRFIVRENGKWMVTPLMLVLLVIETTDIVFALDSIPAIFAVTDKPFIVYTSNVFAILGLRAMYFMLAGVMGMFRYLKYGLSLVLVFVGVKMLLGDTRFEIETTVALGVVAAILIISVLASIIVARREQKHVKGLNKHL